VTVEVELLIVDMVFDGTVGDGASVHVLTVKEVPFRVNTELAALV
jgi:hypothetical protein